MHRRRYIPTVAAAVTVGCVSEDGGNSNGNANGAGNGNGDTTENGEDGGETEERITVSDVEHRTETEALHYIAGTAHNQSDEDLQFQIRVDWFDENGTLLEEIFSQIRADIAAVNPESGIQPTTIATTMDRQMIMKWRYTFTE